MCATYWIDDTAAIEILELINELNKQFGYTSFSYEQLFPEGTSLSGDIYPKANSDVVIKNSDGFTLSRAYWGFPGSKSSVVFNSRSDKVSVSYFWKKAFDSNRGFVTCNGFYENKKDDTGKNIRYLFTLPNNELIFIAAILDKKADANGNEKEYYSLVTTEANDSVSPIHNRMPLILDENQLYDWVSDCDFAKKVLTGSMPSLIYQASQK